MAGTDRRQTPDVTEELLGNGPAFSFIQAFRLLSRLIRKETGESPDDLELSRRLRVRPELSLNFPGTDITGLQKLRDDPLSFQLTVCFLGLYGASSPLPTFYTEDLLHEQSEDRSITRDFLDIIHTPLYSLLFRVWAKYRLAYQITEKQNPDDLDRLYCLLGLSGEPFRTRFRDPQRLLRYTGLALQLPRSAEGLRAMLADALAAPDLRVIQCVRRTAIIPEDQRFQLGTTGNRLGETTFLGLQIADHAGKFRIQTGPVQSDTLHRFLPDGEAFRDMTEMIGFYLDQPLEWDLEVALGPGQIHTAGLGTEQWSKLGWNTWTFSGAPPAEEASVRLQAVCF